MVRGQSGKSQSPLEEGENMKIVIQIPKGEDSIKWFDILLMTINDGIDWHKNYTDDDKELMEDITEDLGILRKMAPTLEEGT